MQGGLRMELSVGWWFLSKSRGTDACQRHRRQANSTERHMDVDSEHVSRFTTM